MQKRAVIFDMDGILVDSEPLWKQSEHEVYLTVGIDTYTMPCAFETFGLTEREAVASWFETYPWTNKTKEQVEREIIDNTLAKIASDPEKVILPGVIKALELCHQQGFKVGLASSSIVRFIHQVTDIVGIADYFEVRCSAEHLPYGKPHPGVYLLAAEKLGVNPIFCTAIEDSVNGMIASKAARMRSIVVPAPENQQDPRWVVANVKLASLEALTLEHLVG